MLKVQGLPRDVSTALDREYIDDAFELMRRTMADTNLPFAQKIFLYKGLAAMHREYKQDEISAKEVERELYDTLGRHHPNLLSTVCPELLEKFEKDGVMPNYNLIYGIANLAFNERKYKTCLTLINGFQKKFPTHRDVAGNLFLAAKIFMLNKQHPDKALPILDSLEQKFPNHELAFEIKSLKRSATKALNT